MLKAIMKLILIKRKTRAKYKLLYHATTFQFMLFISMLYAQKPVLSALSIFILVGVTKDAPLYFATLLNELFSKQPVNVDKLLFIIIGRQSVSS